MANAVLRIVSPFQLLESAHNFLRCNKPLANLWNRRSVLVAIADQGLTTTAAIDEPTLESLGMS